MSKVTVYEDTTVDVRQLGQGRPVLLLHGGAGPASCTALADLLAERAQVLVPTHPGFSSSERPEWMDTVDDLAYVYLDLLEREDLRDVTVAGFGFGGWIAAEMAVRDTARIGYLVLVDAVGIRVGGREDRDIADLFALSSEEVKALAWHAPPATSDPADRPLDEVVEVAANEEAIALYAWEPYMHHPKLRRRLGRVAVPTLVAWGESDGVVTPEYGRAYAEALPQSRFEVIEEAGHSPHVEQPARLLQVLCDFAGL